MRLTRIEIGIRAVQPILAVLSRTKDILLNQALVPYVQKKGSPGMRKLPLVVAALFLLSTATAAKLKDQTRSEFEEYVASAEASMDRAIKGEQPYLWVDSLPGERARLRDGNILIDRVGTEKSIKIKDGLIHDWIGAVFIPATLDEVMKMLKDYDHHDEIYPEVIDSKLLEMNGNQLRGFLRLKKKQIITVILNTEHEVTYYQVDKDRWHSRSYTTRISEVANAGKPSEYELPDGEGQGFMWELYAYWRFEKVEGGVFAECRTISLSRKIPFGLGFLISPFVDGLPRESLFGVLTATRNAVKNNQINVSRRSSADYGS